MYWLSVTILDQQAPGTAIDRQHQRLTRHGPSQRRVLERGHAEPVLCNLESRSTVEPGHELPLGIR
jgi:hypothetical protein